MDEQVNIKEYILSIIEANDKRYDDNFESQKVAVASALAAAKEAVNKAESAAEKRFESVNEFRNTLSDQQRNLIPRSEATVKFESFEKQISLIESRLDKSEGRGTGLSQGWIYLIGAVGLISIVFNIIQSIK